MNVLAETRIIHPITANSHRCNMTIVSDPKQTQQKQSRGAALGKDMATVDREEDSKGQRWPHLHSLLLGS